MRVLKLQRQVRPMKNNAKEQGRRDQGVEKSNQGIEGQFTQYYSRHASFSRPSQVPKVAVQPPGYVTLGMLPNLSDSQLLTSKIWIIALPSAS